MLRHASPRIALKSLAALVVACFAFALVAGGCSNAKDEKTANGDHDHHHDHPTVGPHGGAILEWGDHEYHIELVFDRTKQQATVYVLDHDMKKTEPTAVETPALRLKKVNELIPLVPAPFEGESAEKSSRYVATHAALAGKEPFAGEVTGKVKGKPNPYFASFDEAASKPTDKAKSDKADADHDHADDAHVDHAHEKDAPKHDGKDDHDHSAEGTPARSTDSPAKDANSQAHGDGDHKDHQHEDGDHKHEDGKQTDEQILKRTEQLIATSESLRMMAEDWERFWFMDKPDHMPPSRIRSGTPSSGETHADSGHDHRR